MKRYVLLALGIIGLVATACGGETGNDGGFSNPGSSDPTDPNNPSQPGTSDGSSKLTAPWTDNDSYRPDPHWQEDQELTNNTSQKFAGIYAYENLTIGDNVRVYSKGISQLVIKVRGTLTLGKGAVIQVRNGYYPKAPTTDIATLSSGLLARSGQISRNVLLFPNTYGQGGNGGRGGQGKQGKSYRDYHGLDGNYTLVKGHGGSGGGGGGGGYGGGTGGAGAQGAYGPGGDGHDGSKGSDNGGDGGYGGANVNNGKGGEATDIGHNGGQSKDGLGAGGGGGGGNGGMGGAGATSKVLWGGGGGQGGQGGGGGGYGGGVLYIAAKNIVYNSSATPRFLVSGQTGGSGATKGSNGEGGLLIIVTTSKNLDNSLWTLRSDLKATDNNAGHGTVSGGPQKALVNPGMGTRSFVVSNESPADDLGTWTDPNTDQEWEQMPSDRLRTWVDAATYCAALRLDGRSDWRLPTHDELLSLTSCSVSESLDGCEDASEPDEASDPCPTICEVGGGKGAEGCYWPETLSGSCESNWWTSTPGEENSSYETLSFADGRWETLTTDQEARARCVRP